MPPVRGHPRDLLNGVVQALPDLAGIDLGADLGVQSERDAVFAGFDVDRLKLPILGSRAASTALLALAEGGEKTGLITRPYPVHLDQHAVYRFVYPILGHLLLPVGAVLLACQA